MGNMLVADVLACCCTLTVLTVVFGGEFFFLVVIQIPLGNDSCICIKRLNPSALDGLRTMPARLFKNSPVAFRPCCSTGLAFS